MKLFTERVKNNIITFSISFIGMFTTLFILTNDINWLLAHIMISIYFALVVTIIRDTICSMKKTIKRLEDINKTVKDISEKFDLLLTDIENKLDKLEKK
jgi:hypothetical protein